MWGYLPQVSWAFAMGRCSQGPSGVHQQKLGRHRSDPGPRGLRRGALHNTDPQWIWGYRSWWHPALRLALPPTPSAAQAGSRTYLPYLVPGCARLATRDELLLKISRQCLSSFPPSAQGLMRRNCPTPHPTPPRTPHNPSS